MLRLGRGAELEIEVAQFTLEDLRVGDRTRQQAGEQVKERV